MLCKGIPMKKLFRRICRRIFITFLSTLILFFSVNSSYFNGELCLKAHAASMGATMVAELGGSYIAQLILTIMASAGIGTVYANNEELQEAVNDYVAYATSSQAWVDQADDVYKAYCEVTGTTYNYKWSDLSGFSLQQEVMDAMAKADALTVANKTKMQGYREGILSSKEYLMLEDYVFEPSQALVKSVVDWVEKSVNGDIENIAVSNYYDSLINVGDSLAFNGNYEINDGVYKTKIEISVVNNGISTWKYYLSTNTSAKIVSVVSNGRMSLYCLQDNYLKLEAPLYKLYKFVNGEYVFYNSGNTLGDFECSRYSANIPVFLNQSTALAYLLQNDLTGITNMVVNKGMDHVIDNNDVPSIGRDKVRSILDHAYDVGTVGGTYGGLTGTLGGMRDVTTDIPDLYTKLIDSILDGTYAGTDAVDTYQDAWEKAISDALDDVKDDPIANTEDPAVAKDKTDALTDAYDDALTNDYPCEEPTEENPTNPNDPNDIFGKDTGGLLSLFNALLYIILILIMLLVIFVSCLAFIIMIFRIPPTTGFLPEDMILGLNYLKTLMIPGMNMSVYNFFMALVYIILLFTVVGLLRKNIDKIHIPKK